MTAMLTRPTPHRRPDLRRVPPQRPRNRRPPPVDNVTRRDLKGHRRARRRLDADGLRHRCDRAAAPSPTAATRTIGREVLDLLAELNQSQVRTIVMVLHAARWRAWMEETANDGTT